MTEQEKREKVINELEHEVARANTGAVELDFVDCVEVSLLRESIALLKAQEADIDALAVKYSDLLDRTLKAPEQKAVAETPHEFHRPCHVVIGLLVVHRMVVCYLTRIKRRTFAGCADRR